MSRNKEKINSCDKTVPPRSIRRVAMDCLARREHSFFELKQKLQIKLPQEDPQAIQLELECLREQNLQSDCRFAEAFVRYRKNKGFGYLHIRDTLRARFVSEDLINQYLRNDDEEWLDVIHSLVQKRLTHMQSSHFGSKDHLKIARFLHSRGFQDHLARQVLATHFCH